MNSAMLLSFAGRCRRLGVSCALLLCLVPGWAAPPAGASVLSARQLKDLSVEQLLQQEVISVSRRPEMWSDAASNVFYISGDASRRSGALVLPEMLRLAPNLFVAQSSAHHWGVTSRGFLRTNAHSSKLLVLIDGRTAYSTLFSNVFWDSADVFLPDLNSIEVLSGPNGANWGANAVNGIINIRTRSAHDTLGSLVHATAGNEFTQFEARHGVRFGDTGAVRVYANRTQREATLSASGVDDDADRWHSTLGGFRADWGAAETGQFTLQGEFNRGAFDSVPLPRAESNHAYGMLTWNRTQSDTSEEWARLYYDYSKRDINGALTQTTHTVDFEFQQRRALGVAGTLLWGGNFRRIRDTAEDTPPTFDILPEKLWYNLYSGFVQHEMPLWRDSLTLTTGLRAEHNHFTGWEYQPTLRAAWRSGHRTAWLSAARAVRTPSRIDRGFFAPRDGPFVIIGGPEFTSERLDAFEIGWRSRPRANFWYSATVFLHDYDDLRSVNPNVPIKVENDVEGRSYGVEAFLDWQCTDFWRLRAGGTWMRQDTWIEPGGFDTERAMGEASVPDYQLFLRNTLRFGQWGELWTSLRRIGEVPAEEGGGGVVPAYTELDASLTWFVRPGLELSITGRHLLNPSHPEIGGVLARREIERNVRVSVRWEF